MHVSRIHSDDIEGTPRLIQTAGAMAFGAMKAHREWCERAKKARPLTADEKRTNREALAADEEGRATLAEARELGATAYLLDNPMRNPFCADVFPRHHEEWSEGYEGERAKYETDA